VKSSTVKEIKASAMEDAKLERLR